MPNISEIISHLDVIVEGGTGIDSSYVGDELREAYPALRRAVLAGEALARAVEDIAPTTDARGSLDFEVFRYRSAIEEKNV